MPMAGNLKNKGVHSFQQKKSNSSKAQAQSSQYLSKLDKLRPTPYYPHQNHTQSSGTREPQFYDLHLAEPLQLQKICSSKDIPEILYDVYKRYMRPALRNTTSADFNIDKIYETAISERQPILKEVDIQRDYDPRTGSICIPLASAMIQHYYAKKLGVEGPKGSQQFTKLLRWSEDPSTKRENALADGYLQPVSDVKGAIHPEILKAFQKDVKLLSEHHISDMLVREDKSLYAGSIALMQAIEDLSLQSVPWMSCGSQEIGKEALTCAISGSDTHAYYKRHIRGDTSGLPKVTGRRTGPDSAIDWWTTHSAVGTGQKRSAGNMDPDISRCRKDSHQTSKPCLESAYTVPKESPDYVHTKSRYITQQTWAELVAVDATFALINSGNHELIIRRHRSTGTLYVSGVIRPSVDTEPSHYILHAALYMASFLDNVSRAQQLQSLKHQMTSSSKDVNKAPEVWHSLYDCVYDGDNLPYCFELEPKDTHDASTAFRALSKLSKRATHIHLTLPPGILAGHSSVQSFRRLSMNGADATANTSKLLALRLDFAQALNESFVWQVTASSSGFSSNLFVVKFAMTEDKRRRLWNEYRVYAKTDAIGDPPGSTTFAVKHFGLFRCSLPKCPDMDILVMEHGGVPLSRCVIKYVAGGRQVKKVIKITREKLQSTIRAFHNSGYIHNGLTLDHFLYRESDNKLRIISYSGATTMPNLEPRKATKARLRDTEVLESGVFCGAV